ncbi:unnamed protein product [Rotaria sp. Silwood2]|nr:unnamed protein product [Rotaria sp. Silwood2]
MHDIANLNKVGFQQKVDYDYGNDILEENEDFFIVAGTDFENDSYVSIGNSVVDYDDESNDGMSLSADENNSPEPNFNTNNISIDHENIHQHNFLSELVQFIHAGNLNKSTTTSLLSLLRSAHFSTIEEIPKTTNALWKKLSIKFCFDTFYFCSTCFTNLNKYQDLCPHCNLKRTANSELCIFSLGEEIKRVVQSNIDVIEWYSLPERQIVADLILSFLAEIPPPLRENVNNILLLGLWHSPVTPPCALLLNKIVDNIKLLIATGINVVIKDEIIHFSLNVQLFNGDLPARAKVNRMVNHNGFYACSRCLFEGERCLYPCGNHTIYKWEDFVRTAPRQRTQEHINVCAQQIDSVNKNIYGVIGVSPISSIISIPQQSVFDYFHLVFEIHFRFLLTEWYDRIKQNATVIVLINKYLDEICYPHSFNRQPRGFQNYSKWKASELRCFMIYTALPVLVKLRLNIPNCFPEVNISHFSFLFIYVRVLRHFDDRNEIKDMPKFIHVYLRHFASLYGSCKELFSVHCLVHLWQQVEQHGGLAYHSLYASESCLQVFQKLAHGSIVLAEQMAFWWCIFRQIRSREVQYYPSLLTDEQLINDSFIDFNKLNNYTQEFNLVYMQTFSELPNSSLKYHSRYKRGLIIYHSLSYNRCQNSNSYNTEVMSNRTTTCITPSRIRKVPRGATNIQTFDDDLDCYEYDECDVDENFPIVREVPIYNHQHRQSSSQHPTHRRKDGIYYTPQTKRKRVEERVSSSSTYSNKDQIDILQLMLKEVNQKMDLMHKKEDDIDKKLDSIDKRLVGLARKVNKCPKPCEPPNVLPVIKYNGRNLLSGTIPPTPAGLMKDLINELFTKEEIIDDKHEQINERTEKIKAAIQAWFFYDDDDNITSFWDFEGKIIRGNQRRGHIFRQKHALADQE